MNYDYYEAVAYDIANYIESEGITAEDFASEQEAKEVLYDDLFMNDDVTGCIEGYFDYDTTFQCVCDNLVLLLAASEKFCGGEDITIREICSNPKVFDTMIRRYVLEEEIDYIVDEMFEFAENGEN